MRPVVQCRYLRIGSLAIGDRADVGEARGANALDETVGVVHPVVTAFVSPKDSAHKALGAPPLRLRAQVQVFDEPIREHWALGVAKEVSVVLEVALSRQPQIRHN